MNTFRKTVRSLGALALAVAGFLGTAQAAPVISISPSSQDLAISATTTVDIVVSGLTLPAEAVGGFAITLDYDASLLTGLSYTLDPSFSMGAYDAFNDFSLGFDGLGSLDLYYLADALLDQGDLAALQAGGTFTLATVEFRGDFAGLSPLTLTATDLSEWDGLTTIDHTSANGSICVGGNCNAVPEPASYGLASIALLASGLAGMRRRRRAGQAA